MKRLGTILMACALVLGLSQCKKENTNANVNEDGEKVYIVLKVEDGQRSDVTPSTGVYTYEEGDKLIVGYNGAYCGVLSYNSSNEFSGYITISEDVSQPLYFYYIGEAAGTVSGESYKFDISDQSEGLPVLACAHSSVNYSSGKSNYHAHLRNKCSLVEFSLAEGTSDAVTVGGMHTVASIDFANGTIVATSTTGDITLYSESATSKWAILLPQAEVPNATVTIGTNEGYTAEVPAISANGYFHGTTGSTPAVAIDNTPAGPAHEYVDLGLPSGLLWATCNVGANAPEEYGDYFAWGETKTKTTYNSDTYQFTDNPTTLLPKDDAATANWGGDWRMPTIKEWEELFKHTTSEWTVQKGVSGWRFTALNGNSLFLPAAGYRFGGDLFGAGSDGRYWSSSLYTGDQGYAWGIDFDWAEYDKYGDYRCYGPSVRAVRPAPQN